MSITRFLWDTYTGIPIVTRVFCTLTVLLSVLVQLELLSEFDLYLNPGLALRRGQIWRLVTCFIYVGQIDISFLLYIMLVYRYCIYLETEKFPDRTDDILWMFVCGMTPLLIMGSALNATFLDQAFSSYLLSVCIRRRNPEIRVEHLGLAVLRVCYLPLVIVVPMFIFGINDESFSVHGFVVGHIYYHAKFIFPNSPNGYDVLKTPKIWSRMFGYDTQELDMAELDNSITLGVVDETVAENNGNEPNPPE